MGWVMMGARALNTTNHKAGTPRAGPQVDPGVALRSPDSMIPMTAPATDA